MSKVGDVVVNSTGDTIFDGRGEPWYVGERRIVTAIYRQCLDDSDPLVFAERPEGLRRDSRFAAKASSPLPRASQDR